MSVEISQKFPNSYNHIMQYNTKLHYIFSCSVLELITQYSINGENSFIINWSGNRPPDMERCNEIAEKIHINRTEVDWMLYVFYDIENNKINILDGIHRLTALALIIRDNKTPEDHLTPGKYTGNIEWLLEQNILINIRMNLQTDLEKKLVLAKLNNSIPVPLMYIESQNLYQQQQKCTIIENIIKQPYYKLHYSGDTIKNSQRPNVIRDKFINVISELYDKMQINSSNIHLLYEKLNDVNNFYRYNHPKDVNMINKCIISGCYLFLDKNWKHTLLNY